MEERKGGGGKKAGTGRAGMERVGDGKMWEGLCSSKKFL